MKNNCYLYIYNYNTKTYKFKDELNVYAFDKDINILKVYESVVSYIKGIYKKQIIYERDIINYIIDNIKVDYTKSSKSDVIKDSSEYKILYITLSNDRYIITLKEFNNYKCYIRRTKTFNISKVDGICVDKFISYGVQPLLSDFNTYMINLRTRNNERLNTNEYHNTDCYEKDFRQLVLMREILEKIKKNFDKEIESISDLYTKN